MSVILSDKLGVRSRKIAYAHNIPIATVESILKSYHKSLSDDILENGRVTIMGLATITAVKNEDGQVVPNARSSSALKERLREKYSQD